MLQITFRYRDDDSNWEWRTQTCVMNSVEECKRIYGLGVDCDYQILSAEKISWPIYLDTGERRQQ